MNLLALLSREVETLVERAGRGVVAVEHGGGAGAGIFLGEGRVLTNAHVVRGSGTPIVRETGGRGLPATLVGRDPATDLALLRVADLDAAPLALAAARVRVGALVVAIGNPLRFERSVSLGVVSAVDRTLRAARVRMEGLIQHDAAINPGNSGGPLLDAEGAVVGVNTARVPWADGIGFAVPGTTAGWVVGELLRHGVVRRRRLGIVAQGVALGPREAARTGRERAVRIAEVRGGTPAQRAGLKAGDLLLDAANLPLSSVVDLHRALVEGAPESAGLCVLRDGRRVSLEVSLPRGRAA